MTVSTRLWVLIGVGITALGMVTAVSAYEMRAVFEAANFGNVNSVPAIVALNKAMRDFAFIRVEAAQFLNTDDSAQRAAITAEVGRRFAQVEAAYREYEPTLVSEEDRRLLAAEREGVAAFQREASAFFNPPKEVKRADLLRQGEGLIAKGRSVNNAMVAHIGYNVELANDGSAKADATMRLATKLSLAVSLGTVVALVAIGVGLLRSLTRQLGGEPAAVTALAHRIAAGDLTLEVPVAEGDTT